MAFEGQGSSRRGVRAAAAGMAWEPELADRLAVLGRFGFWVWEPASNRMHWSERLYHLLGVPPSRAVITLESYQARVHPDDRERIGAAIRRGLRDGQPLSLSHRLARPDHEPGWLQLEIEVQGAPGEPSRVLAFCQDVTRERLLANELAASREALERANEELQVQSEELRLQATELGAHQHLQAAQIERLQALDHLKDDFLAMVSHELRTPLNFILGFGTLLEDGVQGPLTPQQFGSVRRIVEGTERMVGLVDDLLEITRIRAGKLEIRPAAERLAPLVDEVLAGLGVLAERNGIALSGEVPATAAGWFDRARIAQVLTNLIGNALKFTPSGGRVCVRAIHRDDGLRIEVRDTGPGIPEDARQRIFEKFEQLDMSPTRPRGGIGLGLAIARGIVEGHGGRLGIDSPPAGGASFWFTLPTSEPRQA